ncbi:hypothetical protein A4D02_27960 [Niastella koreensis]|uniref:Secretion system C-terminal sorting domain-containing protein n=2 Tax=Niastella koreensis TaxID=354356 RepID=G8TJC8_NIAKG|nr:T9SS type A sorting domain-containing protein [Niastella koreensis]AEV99663.1 hypothetical protein Niako_3353 [Niastella koreensis GR20-10]OQP49914.1 hypothetical protein A4D02_27960 [Niastella koreensis]
MHLKFNPAVLLKASLLFCSLIQVLEGSAQCNDFSVPTPYNANNTNRGMMFNIVTGSNAVTISSLDVNLLTGASDNYQLYYKSGSYVGSETNAAAWTLAGTSGSVTSLGNNIATPIPLSLSITIPAGSTYGFYFTAISTAGGVRYTNSSAYTTIANDANISIEGGIGKNLPQFGVDYNYRSANCTVHYITGSYTNAAVTTTNAVALVSNQSSSGTNIYAESCTKLICKITGSGASPISGSVIAKAWIESIQPTGLEYVKRHYEIAPGANAGTATGLVTLYFTQAEFTSFNSVSALPLPTSAGDATGKANLLIEYRPGTSSTGTGLPNTYTATGAININPADANIVWNSSASRWEVSFNATGFGGYFVKTNSVVLPLELISFSGNNNRLYNHLQWETANQVNTSHFELESSTNAITFKRVAVINAKEPNVNTYNYTDTPKTSGTMYYRLKIIDINDSYSYSKTINVYPNNTTTACSIYPNPATDIITINADNSLVNTRAILLAVNGRRLQSITLNSNNVQFSTRTLARGIYFLQFENGSVLRLIKQ